VDWKPERAVQAKVKDFQNKWKIKQKAWLLRRAKGGTLCVGLPMATSSRLCVNNGLYPQETSVATLYRVLPCQRLDLFTIISSPRKICRVFVLRCHSASHLTCFVSFHQVHLSYAIIQSYNHLQFIQSNKSPSFIHSYNYTFIHEYFHTLMHTQHIHNINSYMVAPVTQSLAWPYPISPVFTYYCVSPQVSKKIINILHLPSHHQKCHPHSVWSRDVTHYEPSGCWRTRVKSFTKAEWILANLLQKPSGFSQTFYQKPSGFSQIFYKSRVDSRKPFIKSRVDSRKPFYKSRVDSRKSCTKPSGFWRNLLRSRVDSRQTFISQTDSLQVFSLIKSSHVPGVLFVCWSLSQ